MAVKSFITLVPYYKILAMHVTSAKKLLLSVIEILASKGKFCQLKINSLMDRFYYKSLLIFKKDFFFKNSGSGKPQTPKSTQTAHWHGPPALFWLSSYVDSHRLAVAPQSGAKNYRTVYYITLNSNCDAQRASNFKKCRTQNQKPKLMHE